MYISFNTLYTEKYSSHRSFFNAIKKSGSSYDVIKAKACFADVFHSKKKLIHVGIVIPNPIDKFATLLKGKNNMVMLNKDEIEEYLDIISNEYKVSIAHKYSDKDDGIMLISVDLDNKRGIVRRLVLNLIRHLYEHPFSLTLKAAFRVKEITGGDLLDCLSIVTTLYGNKRECHSLTGSSSEVCSIKNKNLNLNETFLFYAIRQISVKIDAVDSNPLNKYLRNALYSEEIDNYGDYYEDQIISFDLKTSKIIYREDVLYSNIDALKDTFNKYLNKFKQIEDEQH